MRSGKLILRIFLGIILLLVVLIGVTPLVLYKNQKYLTRMAIQSLNENFAGELVVEDSYISPFRNFPYVSIDLHHARFFGDKHRSAKPIYEIDDLYVGFDVLDILRGQFDVKSLKISGGHLDIVQYENGDINLLLAKKGTTDTTATDADDFHLDLKKITIRHFDVSHLDEATGQRVVVHLDEAEAAFRMKPGHLFTRLDTRFVVDALTGSGDTAFFSNKHLELHTTLDYDTARKFLSLSPSTLLLEEAQFGLSGTVDFRNEADLDLQLVGEKPDFNLFIAFAPAAIAENLKRYRNEGKIFFNGRIQGKVGGGENPLLEVDFGCENAYFLNPGVDKRVDQLRFTGYFTNGENRSPETMELRLTDFRARPGEGTFAGNFVIRNFTDPYIAMNVHSDFNLEFLAQFFGLEHLEPIKGQVVLNMNFSELVDISLPENQLARLKEGIDSDLIIRDLSFELPGYPFPVENLNVHAQMRQGAVELDSLTFRLNNSDIHLSGSLSDLPAIFHHQRKPVEVQLLARSGKVAFKDILAYNPALADSTDEELTQFRMAMAFNTSVDNLLSASPLPRGEFFIKDLYAKLKNYPHAFHDFDADIIITDSTFALKNFSGEIDGSDFRFSGLLRNYPLWFREDKTGDTHFTFTLDSDRLNLQDLLSYRGQNYLPEDYRQEEIRQLHLDGTLALHYDSTFRAADLLLTKAEGKLKVHPLKLQDFKGNIHYEDAHLQVKNFSGRMGESDFTLQGAWYTGNEKARRKRDNFLTLSSNFLDIDQLTNYHAREQKPHEEAFNIFDIPFPDLQLRADLKKVNYHHIWLEDFRADIRLQENHYLYVDTLHMHAADGAFALRGYFNGSNPEHIYFTSTVQLDDIDIEKFMFKIDRSGEDYAISENLRGQVSGRIASTWRVHPDLTPILQEGDATLDIQIKNGTLLNFGPMQAMSGYFKDKNLQAVRFDTLRNTLQLSKGVLNIPSMNINSSLGFIEVSGRQSLDLNMDYYVRIPIRMVTQVGFRALFGRNKNVEADPEQEDEIVYRDSNRRVRFLNLRIAGTPEDFTIGLGRDREGGV